MLHEQLKTQIKNTVKRVYGIDVPDVHVEHPENQEHGDFSTNISFHLSKSLKQPPYEIAKNLAYELLVDLAASNNNTENDKIYEKIDALQPGFINFHLSNNWLKKLLDKIIDEGENYGSSTFWENSKVMVEYTDPNPFKVFHIGHLMTNAIGESLARLFEFSGAEVSRACYQGDVGMHVSKSIWGLMKNFEDDGFTLSSLTEMSLEEVISYLGRSYARGATAFKEDTTAAQEIKNLNVLIFSIAQKYQVETENLEKTVDYERLVSWDKIPFDAAEIEKIYKKGRELSLEYFETLYQRLGTKFDHYFFESYVSDKGYEFVVDNVKNGIFNEDQGAIIYKGEKDGLHTRVFVNSLGLPVYEAKDLGLAFMKHSKFPYDRSFIVTANEINSYFEVVLKAMEKINSDLSRKTTHLGHGMMRFKEGKMSSRTGNVVAGDILLNELKDTVLVKMKASETTSVADQDQEEVADRIAVAAIKYLILKNGIGNDIIYNKDEILGLTGNTGPYLLYTYARTNSVLDLSGVENLNGAYGDVKLTDVEQSILRHIYKLEELVVTASEKASPNIIATFAFELAQKYNTFYSEIPIIKAKSESEKLFRLKLSQSVGQVLANSLSLLGIKVVDRM